MKPTEASDRARAGQLAQAAVGVGIALLVAITLWWRASVLGTLPLWIDESWTAVLSSAPTLRSFTHQMWLDSNAPLYYFLMWLWPFESDLGLRVPGALFTIGAAVLAASSSVLDRRRALFWGALLFLWIPAFTLFIDARYYALLFFLSVGQTIAFVRLLSAPSLRRACWWTGLCGLAALTHYYAAVPAVVQGLYYLARFRRQAVQTWPALLLLAPVFAWFWFHLPRLRLYAEPGISWYARVTPMEAAEYLAWPLGGNILVGCGILLIAIVFRERKRIPDDVAALFVTAAISMIILLGAGMIWPMFTQRYLIPLAPPLLFCVAAAVRPIAFLPIATLLFFPMRDWALQTEGLQERARFGLELPARLVPSGRTVTWMIDYAGAKVHDPAQMEDMLRDAFRRNGKNVAARWGTDFEKGDALILIHHNERPLTVSLPAWSCRSMSGFGHTTVVCSRTGQWMK